MKRIIQIIFILFMISGCSELKRENHENHDIHTESEHVGHEGESKEAHNSHNELKEQNHSEETEVAIAPEFIKMAGITLTSVQTGKISTTIDLSGEIGFNEDHLVHITPRFAGILKEAPFKIGDYVKEGITVATIESNSSMTPYSLKAPISGRIIEKHAASGEHVSEEESLYMLADLATVWANLAVYQKDAGKVKVGQKVSISSVGSDNTSTGTIEYITPVMDPLTRKITARIVLQNSNDQWRPGSFVNAHIEIGEGDEGLIIDRNAVQILNDKKVVFIQHEPNTFKPVEVLVGESDFRNIRILGGLEAGMEYVNNGAFELKAKVVTSSMGSHAGHGH